MSIKVKAIVVSKNCPYCGEVKEELASRGLLEKVKIIDVDTPDGRAFAIKNQIKYIPECVVICEDGKCVPCTSQEYRELLEKGK
jgi:predicted thioredoxin/glutaredoxin